MAVPGIHKMAALLTALWDSTALALSPGLAFKDYDNNDYKIISDTPSSRFKGKKQEQWKELLCPEERGV